MDYENSWQNDQSSSGSFQNHELMEVRRCNGKLPASHTLHNLQALGIYLTQKLVFTVFCRGTLKLKTEHGYRVLKQWFY